MRCVIEIFDNILPVRLLFWAINLLKYYYRSSRPGVFWRYEVNLQDNTHPCRSAFSIKLQSNFIEMSLWHGCSPVNLLYIFGTHFPKNTSGRLPLPLVSSITAFGHQAYNNLHTLISLRRLLNYAFFCSVFLG